MTKDNNIVERRTFLKQGAAVGAGVLAATVPGGAQASRHPHPNPGSAKELDRNQYIHNMEILAHYQFPNEKGTGHLRNTGKSQIMAFGRRRVLLQAGNVYDITEPKKVSLIKAGAFEGGQIQLAYNRSLKKWILITGAGSPHSQSTPEAPRGKYDDPSMIERAMKYKGLRGVRIWDATDPTNIQQLSEWSCDQGDPSREVQEGEGTHRNWYNGGKYAYLDTAPDNSFTNVETTSRIYSDCIQTIDVSDPMKPKFVSNWWFPGQKNTEMEEYKKSREYGDKHSWNITHGPMVVPINVEDGGKYGYTAYGSRGVTIHDCSDPKNPKLLGVFDSFPHPGGIPFHTVDPLRIHDRGIVIANPEAHSPDCNEPYHDTWIIDVKDPRNPKALSRLPVPEPPPTAPYESFCQKRGRFNTHNPPHAHAPGKPHPNVTMLAFFNAGLQVYDITRLDAPKISGYFIPPQVGDLNTLYSFNRDTDNVMVEWDRNLIWAMTTSGFFLLSHPQLGSPSFEPAAVKEWALPGQNRGHDDVKSSLTL